MAVLSSLGVYRADKAIVVDKSSVGPCAWDIRSVKKHFLGTVVPVKITLEWKIPLVRHRENWQGLSQLRAYVTHVCCSLMWAISS